MLNHAWLPQLPHLNRLALVGCALHAAEPGVVLSEGGRGALGDQVAPTPHVAPPHRDSS